MKQYLFFTFFLISGLQLWSQNESFELTVTFKPFQKQYIYLGYYSGKQKPIVDSVLLDENSVGVFKKDKKIEKGVYLIGFPNKSGYFEILIDKEQKFSVFADSSNILNSLKFKNSPDNELFIEYQKFTAVKGKEIEFAKLNLSKATTKADSLHWITTAAKSSEEIHINRESIVTKNPDATITALLNAMKMPVVPPSPTGKYDSVFAYKYYTSHFWDNTYFFDERLVRTSFFEEKLDQYFEQLIYPDPDSVIKEIDWMLGYASINDEMQKFLLIKFVNRYLNVKFMWEDRVFVHLFEKYFSQKEYSWLTEKGKKTIFDRAYSMMANLFGSQASNIELPDSTGKLQSLFSIQNPYTVVVFWDPACGHCKETLPKMDSIYKAKWRNDSLKIYAIAKETDGSKKDWIRFINDHQLKNWTHVYYSKADNDERVNNNIPSYFQLYDIQTVPTLYLLDKDKRILAKKIPFEQIDEVLQYKLKNNNQ